jgi:hypothetical protein
VLGQKKKLLLDGAHETVLCMLTDVAAEGQEKKVIDESNILEA